MGPRQAHWDQIQKDTLWDVVIIGGGATGLGVAVHAATQGWKTLLVERTDFAKGTSSRSTKLIHGGVRYLQQGNIRLVQESLRERGLLMKNAPHLVQNLGFVIPAYSHWKRLYYSIGLKVYDRLAGRLGLGKSRLLSSRETLDFLPNLSAKGLIGGILYHDGQFDDAQLAVSLARTAAASGATMLNHCSAIGLLKSQGNLTGIQVQDELTGTRVQVRAKHVVNATGAFGDALMVMDNRDHKALIRPSQGVHIIVAGSFMASKTAMLIPKTDDGRILFAVPWHGFTLLGTTDTAIDTLQEEPQAMDSEIEFILNHTGRYLNRTPQKEDILSIFAGIRPLVKSQNHTTRALSREHLIRVSPSGMISVLGGKWTTYRKMAADVIRKIIKMNGDHEILADTRMMRMTDSSDPPFPASISGLDPNELQKWIQIAIETSMCMTVEDFLARRTRQLFLDAQHAMARAREVAICMARIHGHPESWIETQIDAFSEIAKGFLPK